MNGKILNVRKVGFPGTTGDARSPESFFFPACLTSLMECIGEDVRWVTIQAHGREWTSRLVYKDILAASGMAFGLVWRNHPAPNEFSFPLTDDPNDMIRHAFAWMGYTCEIIERQAGNEAALWAKITAEIDAGRPVLAFDLVGPDCGIVAGYDADRHALIGWSFFQNDPAVARAENGMFIAPDWHRNLRKIAVCGPKRDARVPLQDVVRRGLAIMERTSIEDGTVLMGLAAYDAWIAFVQNPAFETMDDETLKNKHGIHDGTVGNHAELRCYLGNFLTGASQVEGQGTRGDKYLQEAAQCLDKIHTQCWKAWGVLGGMGSPDAYKGLRDAAKRAELAAVLTAIKNLDRQAANALHTWLENVGE